MAKMQMIMAVILLVGWSWRDAGKLISRYKTIADDQRG